MAWSHRSPRCLLSTAAAIMVTRVSSSEDMGAQVNRQMFASPRALAVTGAVMIAMGLVPGHAALLLYQLGPGGRWRCVLDRQQAAHD